ncbi:radical SAM family heme chaperone HemW [Bacteroidota bacterium]
MSGIYIHIPFCRKKCFYCDFYTIVNSLKKDDFLNALQKEIKQRKDYLGNSEVSTIYFGGGSPSILMEKDIQGILNEIIKYFKIKEKVEITLEANPDDLNFTYLSSLRKMGINRLSIGIQSFNNKHLKFLGRRHDSKKAKNSINESVSAGFDNISLDLIYGFQGLTHKEWEITLDEALSHSIQHISAYHLSIEPKTLFFRRLEQGKLKEISEGNSLKQYETLFVKLKEKNLMQYEISSFAIPGYESQHNSNYWKPKKYVGFGPSAHSYNLESRQWNISDVNTYVQELKGEHLPCTIEKLGEKTKFNEFIMTSLRTVEGINLPELCQHFNEFYINHVKNTFERIKSDQFIKDSNFIRLTTKGLFISDRIIQEFMLV